MFALHRAPPAFVAASSSGSAAFGQRVGLHAVRPLCRPYADSVGHQWKSRRPQLFTAQLSDDAFSRTSSNSSTTQDETRMENETSSQASVDLDPDAIKDRALKAVEDVSTRPLFYGKIVAYIVGGVVTLTVLRAIVSAVDSLPVLPGLLELIGLGYCGWFAWRFVIFKSSREELLEEIDDLLGRTTGRSEDQ